MSRELPWLLLDLAGVLLDFAPERRLELIGSISGRTPKAVKARIEADGIGDRLDTGRADGAALASFLSGLCGRAIGETEAWDIWLSPFSVAHTAMQALPSLARHRRLAVFTNNSAEIARLLDGERFEAMFFSSVLGVTKPDPRSFALIETALGVSGNALTFIDDGAGNVQAAVRAGWRAVLYRGPETFREFG